MTVQEVVTMERDPDSGVWSDGKTIAILPSQVVRFEPVGSSYTYVYFTDGTGVVLKPNYATVKAFMEAA